MLLLLQGFIQRPLLLIDLFKDSDFEELRLKPDNKRESINENTEYLY